MCIRDRSASAEQYTKPDASNVASKVLPLESDKIPSLNVKPLVSP